jgi:hypothetical protein
MSEIKVNKIQGLDGTHGPVMSGTVEMNSTGAMSLPRGDTSYRGGRGRGLFGGGRTSPEGIRETIDYFTISTTGNALDFGNLTTATSEFGACASSTRGVFMGGETFPTNIDNMQYVTVQSTGNSFDFGNLTLARRSVSSVSDNTRGVCLGGNNAPGGVGYTLIDYITIASLGNASKFGDLIGDSSYGMAHASPTRGVIALSNNPYESPFGNFTNTIEYITISTEGNGQNFGDLSQARKSGSSASNSTRGLFLGGNTSPATVNTIDYITIASLGDAIDFGDCIAGCQLSSAASTPTRIVFGDMTSDGNALSYVTINTLGNAADFGDLTVARNQTAACSDSHGGLG